MSRLKVAAAALVVILCYPFNARAQDPNYQIRPIPVENQIGWEVGQSVFAASRSGELGLHFGVSQGNNLVALRMGILDETNSVPCSLGVMYQFVGFANTSTHIKPTANVALGRVFSCASDNDPRRASPNVTGTGTLGGGVRLAVFNGKRITGSLDLMGYVERLSGINARADRTTKGVMLGFSVRGPW